MARPFSRMESPASGSDRSVSLPTGWRSSSLESRRGHDALFRLPRPPAAAQIRRSTSRTRRSQRAKPNAKSSGRVGPRVERNLSRSNAWPRWRRVFTVAVGMPRESAASAVLRSSTSRSMTTERYSDGRPSMAASTMWRSSRSDTCLSGPSAATGIVDAIRCRSSERPRFRRRRSPSFTAIRVSHVENFASPAYWARWVYART